MSTLQTAVSSFPGGLSMPHHKRLATGQPIQTLAPSTELLIPLAEHPHQSPEPLVSAGERVLAGQVLCRAVGPRAALVHAPVGGRVLAIEEAPIAHPAHPEGIRVLCIRLLCDRGEETVSLPAVNTDDPEDILAQVARAGVVGLGGALFPTLDKLRRAPADTLIINGAECEPYIACDEALMLEHAGGIVRGAQLAAMACGAATIRIAIEDHRPETREQLLQAIQATGDARLSLTVVPTRYPEGGERQLIQVLTGREVPAGQLPQALGMLMLNVATVFAIAEAVDQRRPLTHRIVTVTGPGVASPRNLLVPIGTPVRYLIQAAGGYCDDASRLIMGGPMMGVALPHDDMPVTRATNCLLVLTNSELQPRQPEMPCIGCMDCVSVCPAGLLPQQLHRAIRVGEFERSRQLNLFACIECGCCAEVCPSHIPLVEQYRYAKATLQHRQRERERAELARQRYEAREARLARQKADREARLKAKQERLAQQQAQSKSGSGSGDAKKDAIAAAVARAKKKKQSGGDS